MEAAINIDGQIALICLLLSLIYLQGIKPFFYLKLR